MNKVFIFSIVLWFCACGESTQKTTTQTSPVNKASLKAELDKLENSLLNSKAEQIDVEKASNLVHLSLQFVDSFPEDSNSPAYLFRAGEVSVALRQYEKALDLWEEMQTQYPKDGKAAIALFLQGFTCDEQMQDTERAKAYYQAFLEKYPDHQQAKQVQMLLNNLALSPEDLIKSFKEKKQ